MKTQIGCLLAGVAIVCLAAPAGAQSLTLGNPDWEIILTDYGYSDLLLDKTPGRVGREYLSGEWGAAVGYKVGAMPVTSPVWMEPNWIFPDWTTNSDFAVITPITPGPLNGAGLPTAMSTIANADLTIDIGYEMLDSTTGIEQGIVPASAGGAGASRTSNRYVLNQTYTITNTSGETITDLQAFQFLHGLNSTLAVYDDRFYGGAMGVYHYDTFQVGTSMWFNSETNQEELLEDVLTLHSDIMPSGWEVGHYGKESVDDHGFGKPSVGVHLSVEANALSGLDFFDPPTPDDLWVSGAQRYDLVDLAHGESTTYDVLLSIDTIPEPATMALLSLGGLALLRRRRR